MINSETGLDHYQVRRNTGRYAAPDSAAIVAARCHAFRKASRSALTFSACVVGMPCGKPL